MSIQHALLPHKHIRFCDSLIALAGRINSLITGPITLDELWVLVDRDSGDWPSRPSFTHLVYAVDVLYAIGQVQLVSEDRIMVLEQ